MTDDFVINERTRLNDILARYPWIKQEVFKIDERFRFIDSPIGRMLMKRATIADLGKRAGLSTDEIIEKLHEMIKAH